jgi:AAA+ superfamily predicted ATPase
MREENSNPDLSTVNAARLQQLVTTFSLTPLERDILLEVAAPEISPERSDAADIGGWPTANAVFQRVGPDADWNAFRHALRSDAPLRHWRLIALLNEEGPLASCLLAADPRIAEFLLGSDAWSAEVARIARLHIPVERRESNALIETGVAAIARFSRDSNPARRLFLVLSGPNLEEMEDLAGQIAARANLPLLAVDATSTSAADRKLVLRESLLLRAAVLVHSVPADELPLLATAGPIVFLASPTLMLRPPLLAGHGWIPLPVQPLSTLERMHRWSDELGRLGADPAEAVFVAQAADLTAREIHHIADSVAEECAEQQRSCTTDDLIRAVRSRVQHRIGDLCQRIPSTAKWSDLVISQEVRLRLEELCQQSRLQQIVLDQAEFGRHLPRGRAATALFCGLSGTGKTLAASVIAHELCRELYRVDLARVVSKYIGETEMNLREIFAEAEAARAVLFFDEADALFGKRTEIRDSHDRFANIGISYLLQLFEDAEFSVVLLASNRRDAIDEAFFRRFRFVIDFPMPNAALRRALWESSFSHSLPVDPAVRLDVLADRLPLSGASIRNIALAAAFLAVAEDSAKLGRVGAAHILHAAKRECEKVSTPMPLTVAELSAPCARVRSVTPAAEVLQ